MGWLIYIRPTNSFFKRLDFATFEKHMMEYLMSFLSERVASVKPSPTLAIDQKAKELKAAGFDVVNLAAGEPDFLTPSFICDAAIAAIQSGKHKYTAVDGIPELKAAIINKFKTDNGLSYAADQIIVSAGAKMVLYSALMATINPGDEVVIPSPYWVSYPDMVSLAGGTPVFIPCHDAKNFKFTPEQLRKALNSKTKWLILNSPNNPCGLVYTKAELEAFGAVLRDFPQVHVMTDDIYEYLVYGAEKFHTIAQVCPDLYERTLTVNGASKAYAMTGWRLGYGAGPAPLIKAMKTIQSQSTSNPCSITQYAALAALTNPRPYMDDWRKQYTQRRDAFVGQVNQIQGLSCETPAGAFYIFIRVEGLLGLTTPAGRKLSDDMDIASFMLDDCQVAVTPGSVFGMSPYVRVSYATSLEEINKACHKLSAGIAKLT
jgi:aspartate aminotransferase